MLLAGVATTLSLFVLSQKPVAALQAVNATATATSDAPSSSAYITVTYNEPINVRTGPSSFDYPVIGSLPVGGTAPAVGRSPAGEWIQIVFPDAPRGTGWVYAANVVLSPGSLLPIIEPPPTAVPLVTRTIDPTFLAAFQTSPTSTRLPTFTAPPPLSIPTFVGADTASSTRSLTAWVMVGLGILGILGLIFTSLRRR